MKSYETVFEFESNTIETKKQELPEIYAQAGRYLGKKMSE